MIICENCGRENEDEYKFCLGCGSALPDPQPADEPDDEPQMIDCPHCSTTVPSNFKFCGACGGAIQAQREKPAPRSKTPQRAAAQSAAEPAVESAAQQQVGAQASAPAPEPAQAPATGPKRSTDPAGKPQPSNASAPAQPAAAKQRPEERIVARLVVIRPDGSEGAEIGLRRGEQVIGRESQANALANDPFLSPQHATFTCTQDSFYVRDEGSLNGVFVRVDQPIELRHEDQIRIGQELLRYEDLSAIEPAIERVEEETLIAGSPDDSTWGRLCLVAGPGVVTRAFALGDEAVTIGREEGDILFRDDGFVSGTHA
ncbi:MAG: FHA domain-containing protein, partial [Persicimonas sp.]